jgi:hypothetical protein
MRLLHTSTLEQRLFANDTPAYAILSHTWGDDEITFQDLVGSEMDTLVGRKGYDKVRSCCAQAREDGFDWVWIDTCCIDKTSSAELSETINSMYSWYGNASVCYAYLEDVSWPPKNQRCWTAAEKARFKGSRWFKRGWTLQELIAPRYLEFYSSNWSEIGTKKSLLDLVEEATGIDRHALDGQPLEAWPISARMSWASDRETTREEDSAYCLLGIFNVHMPMIYGEGARAFQRLQEEILRREPDLSIIAWSFPSPRRRTRLQRTASEIPRRVGLLAATPKMFSQAIYHTYRDDKTHKLQCAKVVPITTETRSYGGSLTLFRAKVASLSITPPLVTSRGLRVTMCVKEIDWTSSLRESRPTALLAWTFCVTDKVYLCLRLECEYNSNQDLEPQWYRTGHLIGYPFTSHAPTAGLSEFTTKSLYISMTTPRRDRISGRDDELVIATVLREIRSSDMSMGSATARGKQPSQGYRVVESEGPVQLFTEMSDAVAWKPGPQDIIRISIMYSRIPRLVAIRLRGYWTDPEKDVVLGLGYDTDKRRIVAGLIKIAGQGSMYWRKMRRGLEKSTIKAERFSETMPDGNMLSVKIKRGAASGLSTDKPGYVRYNVVLEIISQD